MNINKLKQALPFLMRAKVPGLLVGHHGVGKPQSLNQFAKETNAMLKILNLGTQEVGDIIGLADFIKDSNGQNIATKFMIPDWAKDLHDFCVKNPHQMGILFLDEVNRARKDVLQVIFPLLTEKRIHGLHFPENFYVLAAMNPDTEDYQVTDISDKAFISRFCHIKVESNYQDFIEYGKTVNLHKSILSFISTNPGLLRGAEQTFDLKYVQPDNRNWERVAHIRSYEDIPEDIRQELIAGLVGLEASTSLKAFLANAEKPVSGIDIIKNYPKVQIRIQKQSDPLDYKADLINETKEQVLAALKEKNGEVTDKQYENILCFVQDLPNDLAVDFLRRIIDCQTVFLKLIEEKSLTEKLRHFKSNKKAE